MFGGEILSLALGQYLNSVPVVVISQLASLLFLIWQYIFSRGRGQFKLP